MEERKKKKYLYFDRENLMIPLTYGAWKRAFENMANRPYHIAVIYEPIKKK